jgi:hypothetical protein
VVNKAEIFFKEFVIGLGFFSGLWLAIGFDPEAELFKALADLLKIINPEFKLGIIFFIIPILLTVISIYVAWNMGGQLGLIAVLFGFIAGVLIIVTSGYSFLLLIIGGILAFFAVE